MSQKKSKKGVFFSANDRVLKWTIAFLNSFRQFNPDLALYLIPFNEDCEQLFALKEKYQFEIYTDPTFERLEKIGHDFELGHTDYGPYWFRRYAAFWGPLDEFMYLDGRQLILTDLSEIIAAPKKYGYDFMFYDCAIDQVYEPGTVRQSFLHKGMGRGFNSGRWAAVKGVFTMEEFEEMGAAAINVRDQLNPRNTDQAFINFCCDTKGIKSAHIAEVLGGYCQEGWAGQRGQVFEENGGYYLWDHGGLEHKKQFFLLHWGGISLTASMPERRLFLKFLNQKTRLQKTKDLLQLPAQRSLAFIRKSRWINSYYHALRKKISY